MKRLNEIGTAKKAVYSIFVFFWIFVAYSAHAVENCIDNSAQGFPCHNVDLLSYVSLDEMQVGKGRGSDIWGWTDSLTGKEYVLFGHSTGISFIDISDPENPAVLGRLAPRVPNPNPNKNSDHDWRDMRVYADNAYVVSEGEGTGLQVFDLTQLRGLSAGNRTFSATYEDASFGHAHNITLNPDSAFAYVVGSFDCGIGGLLAFDLSTPQVPHPSGCLFGDTYTHDSQCVTYMGPDPDHQGAEICFNSNPDYYFEDIELNKVAIVDVTNKSAPFEISKAAYPQPRYLHQGWLTEDHSYFLLNDETDEWFYGKNTSTVIIDVRDLDNPAYIGEFTHATRAHDHNLFVHNGLVYEANYTAGLSVLNTVDVANGNLIEIGFFDTYPQNNQRAYTGAWGVYPYFTSGSIAISTSDRGLFVVRLGPNRNAVPESARKSPGQKNPEAGG